MRIIPLFIRKLGRFSHRVALTFFEKNCNYRAAALSYTFLLSLVPLLTVSFALLMSFPLFTQFTQQMQDFIFDNFVATSAQMVQQHFAVFLAKASKLSIPGMLFLLITAVLMLFNLEQSFNAIWEVKKHRGWLSAFLLYWGMLTVIPLLIGIGLVISAFLFSLSWLEQTTSLKLKQYLLFLAPYLSAWAGFTLLYAAVPNCKVRLCDAMRGGLVAAVLFELAKQGFAFYIKHFPMYHLVYGALAGIVIFLVWIYVCWLIVLFGAVVCAALGVHKPTA